MEFLRKHFVAIFFFLALFAVTIFLPDSFIEGSIEALKNQGVTGGLTIVGLILFMTTVVAPLNSMALIPIASAMYGWVPTALVAIISWGLAAVVAFLISRYLGRPALSALGFTASISKIEKRIPEHISFWSIVFLRIVLPVDVLSYALGIFSTISLSTYTIATFIGITPFAIIFSILGDAYYSKNYPLFLSGFAAGAFLMMVVFFFYKKTKN